MLERLNVDKFKHNIPDRSFYSVFEISRALNISLDGILDYLASGDLKAQINVVYINDGIVSIGGRCTTQQIFLEKDKSFISFNGGLGLNINLSKKNLFFEVKGELPKISYIKSTYAISFGKINKKNYSLENRDVSFNAYFNIHKHFFSENQFSLSQDLKEANLFGKCKLAMKEDGFFSNLTLTFKKPYTIELGQIKISHADLMYFLTKEQKPIDSYKVRISYLLSLIDSELEAMRNIAYNKFFKRKDINKPYRRAKAEISKLQNIIDESKDSSILETNLLSYDTSTSQGKEISRDVLEYQADLPEGINSDKLADFISLIIDPELLDENGEIPSYSRLHSKLDTKHKGKRLIPSKNTIKKYLNQL
ncbi:hypothetical protein [Aggregatibacter kilianii]|uniref:hypothetical protein n=1 Tax=Aggregatibacter kilianii TaxID=2025884 RepID=UPI000D651F69|nr:hypothetical protein [Aggregatibacter kilianii]RDE83832.1 hypothetical protein DPV90_10745 [Aggregatibacter aphrophilus]